MPEPTSQQVAMLIGRELTDALSDAQRGAFTKKALLDAARRFEIASRVCRDIADCMLVAPAAAPKPPKPKPESVVRTKHGSSLTEDQKRKVRSLSAAGVSMSSIALEIGRSRTAVSNFRRLIEKEAPAPTDGPGLPVPAAGNGARKGGAE